MCTNIESNVRSTPRLVSALALSIVVFSLVNVVFLSTIVEPTTAKMIQRGIRFLLTCGLAYFLFRGASWARWVTVVLAVLTVLVSLIGFAVLPASVPLLYRVWSLVMAAFYASVASLLLFSSSIVSHFRSLTAPER